MLASTQQAGSASTGCAAKKKEPGSLARYGTLCGSIAAGTALAMFEASDNDMLVSRSYIQRIALPGDGLTRGVMEHDDAVNSGGMLLDDPEEALSQTHVKMASTQAILAQDKKKKRVLKKVKDNLNDSSDDNIPGLDSGAFRASSAHSSFCHRRNRDEPQVGWSEFSTCKRALFHLILRAHVQPMRD